MVDTIRGELNDFTGKPIVYHAPERPIGFTSDYQPVYRSEIWMPFEGAVAGMIIKCLEPVYKWRDGYKEIVVLYDRWGHILKQWPEGYIPGIDEIRQAVKTEAFLKEGRRL